MITKTIFQPGQSYRTRDGREARVYATDGVTPFVIHGAVKLANGWDLRSWGINGRFDNTLPGEDLRDLMPPKLSREDVATQCKSIYYSQAGTVAGLGPMLAVLDYYDQLRRKGQFDE